MAKTKNKRIFVLALLIILLLVLSVGYAAFSDVLTISGTANIASDASFDLIFVQNDPANNITGCAIVSQQGTDSTNSSVTIADNGNQLNVNVAGLKYPGAGAVVRAVIKNNGTIAAKLGEITPTNINGNTNAIKIIGLNQYVSDETIAPGATCTVEFTVEWDSSVNNLNNTIDGENGNDFSFGLVLNYDQDTSNITNTSTHTNN